jgi:serralysin
MADTIFLGGTAASETLTGGAGRDVIYGQGGTDLLVGGDENDSLNSGEYVTGDNGSLPDYLGDYLDGGNGNDQLIGGSGSDFLKGGAGTNTLNGGIGGYDTAIYAGTRGEYTLAMVGGFPAGIREIAGAGQTDTLDSVERLSFSDVSVAYDFEGNAGKIYRLYQAALGREPVDDEVGLGWWIKRADDGLTMVDAAKGFMNNPEWEGLYGADRSDKAFVANLYRNALGREAEDAGLAHWINHLENGMSRENVLISFAESQENRDNIALVGNIENGIEYLLYTTV